MADFNRYTRECSFSQFRPELMQALRDYIENQKLVGIEIDILMCCETTSEKKTPGEKTAGVLAFGTMQQVRDEVKRLLEIMMPGGGFALAPTHLIQSNSPVENVLAMYDAAREFGCYG